MAQSSIRMASPADDAALRSLFRETPLAGCFEITMEREPSYLGHSSDTLQHDVFIGTRDEKVVFCGSRTVREAWWEGHAARVAYLGDLRCHPTLQRRAGWLIRDGYRALEQCHAHTPAAVTWTAVLEENTMAREILTGRSAGLPAYVDRGRLHCPIILVSRWARIPKIGGLTFHQGQSDKWEEIATFLNTQLQHRPLAPVHRASDFENGVRWPGLMASDFILARRQSRLVGVVSVWDVRRFKQVRISAVRGWIGRFRSLINVLAGLSGWPRMPDEGTVLPMGCVSFLATENEDEEMAGVLLRAARAAAARRGLGFLCACVHENHSFARVLNRLPAIASHGRLYQVALGGTCPNWPESAPHIEPALL